MEFGQVSLLEFFWKQEHLSKSYSVHFVLKRPDLYLEIG